METRALLGHRLRAGIAALDHHHVGVVPEAAAPDGQAHDEGDEQDGNHNYGDQHAGGQAGRRLDGILKILVDRNNCLQLFLPNIAGGGIRCVATTREVPRCFGQQIREVHRHVGFARAALVVSEGEACRLFVLFETVVVLALVASHGREVARGVPGAHAGAVEVDATAALGEGGGMRGGEEEERRKRSKRVTGHVRRACCDVMCLGSEGVTARLWATRRQWARGCL
mmetsp:Transcript_23875/g.62023  ORF Transcript_23875/g.62023 Transcript_23875/m.62023 type:complete len:226 (+) Transcript_23875:181-858(+)